MQFQRRKRGARQVQIDAEVVQIGDKIIGSAPRGQPGDRLAERFMVFTIRDGKIVDKQQCTSRRGAERFASRRVGSDARICRWPRGNGKSASTVLAVAEVAFERVSPVVTVHDLEDALARYRRLGFEVELDESAGYGFVRRGGVELHLTPADPDESDVTGAVVYVFVTDADALHAEWVSAGVGGRFLGPHDTPYGLREFVYTDADRTVHRVGSPLD